MALAGTTALTGCSSKESGRPISTAPLEGWTAPDYKTEYYDNYQYNAYYNPEEAAEHLPDQGMYGSGNALTCAITACTICIWAPRISVLLRFPAGSRKI